MPTVSESYLIHDGWIHGAKGGWCWSPVGHSQSTRLLLKFGGGHASAGDGDDDNDGGDRDGPISRLSYRINDSARGVVRFAGHGQFSLDFVARIKDPQLAAAFARTVTGLNTAMH